MNPIKLGVIIAFFCIAAPFCFTDDVADKLKAVQDLKNRLSVQDVKITEDNKNDWMRSNPNDPSATFDRFLKFEPKGLSSDKTTIYIQTLGSLTPEHAKTLSEVREFLHAFYQMPVEIKRSVGTQGIPSRRGQLDADAINASILHKQREQQKDAAAIIGVTESDLFARAYSFVFGHSSDTDRVNIWSMNRFGDSSNPAELKTILRRSLRISAHELGHSFTMHHCKSNRCLMNGYNHLRDLDQAPLEMCSECLAKLFWMIGVRTPKQLKKRYENLIAFGEKNGLAEEVRTWKARLSMLPKSAGIPSNLPQRPAAADGIRVN